MSNRDPVLRSGPLVTGSTSQTHPDSFDGRVIAGTAWAALEKGGQLLLGLLTFVLLARRLPPEAFGLVAMATIYTQVIQEIIDFGLGRAIVQRRFHDRAYLDAAFWGTCGVGILLSVLGMLAAPLFAGVFREPQLVPIVGWLSLIFIAQGAGTVQRAVLQRDLKFRSLAMRQLIASSIGALTALILAYNGAGVWSIVAQQLVSTAFDTVFVWRASSYRPHLQFSWSHYVELASFGRYVLGTKLLFIVSRRSDDALIGLFLGATQLGYYSMAYRVIIMSSTVLQGVADNVVYPVLARLARERERMNREMIKISWGIMVVIVPFFMFAAAFAPQIVHALFGPRWEPAVPVMRLLALAGVARASFTSVSAFLYAANKPDWRFRLALANTAAMLFAFFAAVRWGIVAVAGAFLVTSMVFVPVNAWVLWRASGLAVRQYLAGFVRPLFAAGLAWLALVAVASWLPGLVASPIAWLTVGTFAATLFYIGLIWKLSPASLRDTIKRSWNSVHARLAGV